MINGDSRRPFSLLSPIHVIHGSCSSSDWILLCNVRRLSTSPWRRWTFFVLYDTMMGTGITTLLMGETVWAIRKLVHPATTTDLLRSLGCYLICLARRASHKNKKQKPYINLMCIYKNINVFFFSFFFFLDQNPSTFTPPFFATNKMDTTVARRV